MRRGREFPRYHLCSPQSGLMDTNISVPLYRADPSSSTRSRFGEDARKGIRYPFAPLPRTGRQFSLGSSGPTCFPHRSGYYTQYTFAFAACQPFLHAFSQKGTGAFVCRASLDETGALRYDLSGKSCACAAREEDTACLLLRTIIPMVVTRRYWKNWHKRTWSP